MITHLDAGQAEHELWSPDDIREDLPEVDVADDQIGILIGTCDHRDGVLLVGTEEQIIARMEAVIALVRRERAILDGLVLLDAAAPTFGDKLTEEQDEALRDGVEADQAAGDADWRGGATYVYVLDTDTTVRGVVIPAGVYIRQVLDDNSGAWQVLGGDVDAFIDATEQMYLDETDGD